MHWFTRSGVGRDDGWGVEVRTRSAMMVMIDVVSIIAGFDDMCVRYPVWTRCLASCRRELSTFLGM